MPDSRTEPKAESTDEAKDEAKGQARAEYSPPAVTAAVSSGGSGTLHKKPYGTVHFADCRAGPLPLELEPVQNLLPKPAAVADVFADNHGGRAARNGPRAALHLRVELLPGPLAVRDEKAKLLRATPARLHEGAAGVEPPSIHARHDLARARAHLRRDAVQHLQAARAAVPAEVHDVARKRAPDARQHGAVLRDGEARGPVEQEAGHAGGAHVRDEHDGAAQVRKGARPREIGRAHV